MQIKVIISKNGYTIIAEEGDKEIGRTEIKRTLNGFWSGEAMTLTDQLDDAGLMDWDTDELYDSLDNLEDVADSVMYALDLLSREQ